MPANATSKSERERERERERGREGGRERCPRTRGARGGSVGRADRRRPRRFSLEMQAEVQARPRGYRERRRVSASVSLRQCGYRRRTARAYPPLATFATSSSGRELAALRMRVLVTGAAGRVGGCVAAGLQHSGHTVRVHDVVDVPGNAHHHPAAACQNWAPRSPSVLLRACVATCLTGCPPWYCLSGVRVQRCPHQRPF